MATLEKVLYDFVFKKKEKHIIDSWGDSSEIIKQTPSTRLSSLHALLYVLQCSNFQSVTPWTSSSLDLDTWCWVPHLVMRNLSIVFVGTPCTANPYDDASPSAFFYTCSVSQDLEITSSVHQHRLPQVHGVGGLGFLHSCTSVLIGSQVPMTNFFCLQ